MQRTVAGSKGPRSELEALAKIEEDLKSAWYEAQDIKDTVEYHRIEQEVLGHTSSWVRRRLNAAAAAVAACVARCFRRIWLWLGPWINVTGAALLQHAQRFYQLAGTIVHGFLQHAQGFCRQLPEKFRGATTLTTSGPVLPISGSRASMVGTSISSSTSPAALEATRDAPSELGGTTPPLLRQAEKVAEEKEREKVKEEEEEENEEEEEKLKQLIEEEEEDEIEEEEAKEKVREEENGPLYRYIRSMLIWLNKAVAVARSYRDRSYEEVVGIQSNQRNDIAEYSLFPPFGSNSLSKRIEHIVNILDDSKKSHLLNQRMSSSSEIPVKDTNNESSSSEVLVKDTKKESSSRQEQIYELHRKIKQNVIGRDKELKRICEMFRERPDGHVRRPYSVLGIHGIAGSGKSTLANNVCDREKKTGYFDHIMFSHVTMNFRVDKIFRDMLREISKDQQYDDKDIKFLPNELVGKLKGQRFLLVLDDLWVKGINPRERDILLDALHEGKKGSIILVTSRGDDAAAALGARPQDQIQIPDLEEKDFLSLFMHRALQDPVDDDGEYKRIGKIIVGKLHKSPIAAVTVADQLQMSRSIRLWEATANLDVLSSTMGALWWSYQQLDVDIRRCFAYCSTFPAGYKLKRHELVRIWIAQGFVSTTIGNTTEEMEDVGDCYIDELVKFSFLQVRKEDWDDDEEITIHDLLRELAEMVARSDFLRIDSNRLQKDMLPGVRHLFVHTENVAEIVEKNQDLRNLRTLIIEEHHKDNNIVQGTEVKKRKRELEKILECLFMRLRKLRVLIVKLRGSRKLLLPASIDQMKHIRFVHFEYLNGKLIFPSTFSKLYHMQSIDVRPFASYPEESMGNLIHLRHISDSGRLGFPNIFPNIDRLTSLQGMAYFEVKEGQGHGLKQLEHLNKLRRSLMILGLTDVGSKKEADEAHLASKKRLTELTLAFSGHRQWDTDPDTEAEVLEGLCPPKDLQELSIWYYRGSRYPSWMLSGQQHPDAPNHLRKLLFLKCHSRLASFPGDSELFRHLRELKLNNCDWDSMPENMERLVSLESLNITYCNVMKLLPMLPRSLDEISIDYCDVLSRTCQEEGHPNWFKILYIPRILIRSRSKVLAE